MELFQSQGRGGTVAIVDRICAELILEKTGVLTRKAYGSRISEPCWERKGGLPQPRVQAGRKHRPTAVSRSVQRLRRWPSLEPAVGPPFRGSTGSPLKQVSCENECDCITNWVTAHAHLRDFMWNDPADFCRKKHEDVALWSPGQCRRRRPNVEPTLGRSTFLSILYPA